MAAGETDLARALRDVWDTEEERAANINALLSGVLRGGHVRAWADLMRALGVPESATWELLETAFGDTDVDAGEVFAHLYEPGDLEGTSDGG